MLHNSQELAGPGISGGKGLHRATHKMMNWKSKKETVSQPGLLPAQQIVGSTQVISTHFAGELYSCSQDTHQSILQKSSGKLHVTKKKIMHGFQTFLLPNSFFVKFLCI